jgi:hypothetical protein
MEIGATSAPKIKSTYHKVNAQPVKGYGIRKNATMQKIYRNQSKKYAHSNLQLIAILVMIC